VANHSCLREATDCFASRRPGVAGCALADGLDDGPDRQEGGHDESDIERDVMPLAARWQFLGGIALTVPPVTPSGKFLGPLHP